MKYKCSECGGEVIMEMLLSKPPQKKYICSDCGLTRIDPKDCEMEKVINMKNYEKYCRRNTRKHT